MLHYVVGIEPLAKLRVRSELGVADGKIGVDGINAQPVLARAALDLGHYGAFGIHVFVKTLSDVEIGSAPFVIALLIMIALICVYPDLVMWLPRLVGGAAN